MPENNTRVEDHDGNSSLRIEILDSNSGLDHQSKRLTSIKTKLEISNKKNFKSAQSGQKPHTPYDAKSSPGTFIQSPASITNQTTNKPDVSVLNSFQEITEVSKARRDESTDSDKSGSKSSYGKLENTDEKSHKKDRRPHNELEKLIYKEM